MVEENVQILREILNIAFGAAAGELEELTGLSLDLSPPKIADIHPNRASLRSDDLNFGETFKGDLSGSAYIFFTDKIDPAFIQETSGISEIKKDSENKILMEITNILISTTVDKLAELMKLSIIRCMLDLNKRKENNSKSIKSKTDLSRSIYMETFLSFQNFDLNGSMFIRMDYESEEWLDKTLKKFLETYR